ncbi:MAG: large-conductance mechanosensitive channel protein MscL [Candidatus Peribacteraceae bacterium]
MSMLQEFKAFAMRGNVMDLAVGVIIGGAFGKIVSSLVADILMPIIGLISGGVDFSGLTMTVGGTSLKYGMFLQSVIDFVIIAFCIFMMIKMMNRFQKVEAEKAAPPPTRDQQLLTEIRDLLRK